MKITVFKNIALYTAVCRYISWDKYGASISRAESIGIYVSDNTVSLPRRYSSW
jgi:hypothetical protein